MLAPALRIAVKDLRLTAARGSGLVQALLLGLLLVFVLSLSREPGQTIEPQAAAAVFWLATLFCQVLIFNALFNLEETAGARLGLLLGPSPVQSIWLGKSLAGWVLLLISQAVFFPAVIIFLGQQPAVSWIPALAALLLVDWGLVALGALLGALAQGQAARESLLSVILFPLLIPVLLAGIKMTSALFQGVTPSDSASWLSLAGAFDALFSGAGLMLFPFVYSGEE